MDKKAVCARNTISSLFKSKWANKKGREDVRELSRIPWHQFSSSKGSHTHTVRATLPRTLFRHILNHNPTAFLLLSHFLSRTQRHRKLYFWLSLPFWPFECEQFFVSSASLWGFSIDFRYLHLIAWWTFKHPQDSSNRRISDHSFLGFVLGDSNI